MDSTAWSHQKPQECGGSGNEKTANFKSLAFGLPTLLQQSMKMAVLIALGAALGALLRWRLAVVLTAPWGTTGANLLGCLLLGVLLAKTSNQHTVWPFFAIGFCGSLTTFSGFVFDLWRQGNSVSGLHYLSWNLLGGFALFILAIRLFRPDGP